MIKQNPIYNINNTDTYIDFNYLITVSSIFTNYNYNPVKQIIGYYFVIRCEHIDEMRIVNDSKENLEIIHKKLVNAWIQYKSNE